MSKIIKPAFQSVEIDLVDQRLEEQAAVKGIPTLVAPKLEETVAAVASSRAAANRQPRRAGEAAEATPRDRMISLNIDVPDYVWIALKTRAAQEFSSVRHFTLKALREQGIEVRDSDMIEDGRRLRGTRIGKASN